MNNDHLLRNDIAPTLSLDGNWDFALGSEASWNRIQVPGSWEAQGYSKWVDGPAFYRREVFLPPGWAGHRILVEFDAVSYACQIFFNGVHLGEHKGMWTPFAVDVTSAARLGESNILELKIYKPGKQYAMRSCLAGFLPDVATTFGGIWQSARIRAVSDAFDNLLVDPDPETGKVRVRCRAVSLSNLSGASFIVDVLHNGRVVTSNHIALGAGHTLDTILPVPNPLLWGPDQPALYHVRVRLVKENRIAAEAIERIGFRRLSASGNQLLFNDQPVILRGLLSWGWDPDLIAPAFSRQQLRDKIRRARALGFNLIKLCLFVPNQAYFEVADEEGIFLWQEWPLWLPEVTEEMRLTARGEYAKLMRLTRHHPSVVLYSAGCELTADVDEKLLDTLTNTMRGLASDVLFCDNSGSAEAYGGLSFDFSDFSDYHTYSDLHYFEPMLDHWRRDWQSQRPLILGEFCDSDAFRDLEEIIAANGGAEPWWMTEDIPTRTWRPEVRSLLEQHQRLARANVSFTRQQLVQIANAQSLVVRKFTLEAVRRRAGIGGYVITGLRDTPIATSGIVDDLGRPKWSPEEFRPFNDDAILCLDVGRRRRWQYGGDRPDRLDTHNWWAGETARLHLILNNKGAPLPGGCKLSWRLTDRDGEVIAKGEETLRQTILPGPPCEVATIAFTLPATEQARELRLETQIAGGDLEIVNSWPIWSYPRSLGWPTDLAIYDPCYTLADFKELMEIESKSDSDWKQMEPLVVVTSTWNSQLQSYLQEGGRVLLVQQKDGPFPVRRGPFWREAIKLFPPHPLWQLFPQRGYADVQFFGLATDVMFDVARFGERLPELEQIQPIMRRLDAREFDVAEYLLEAQLGRGRLVACALRLQGSSGAQPSGLRRNVAGHFLLWAMLRYLVDSNS